MFMFWIEVLDWNLDHSVLLKMCDLQFFQLQNQYPPCSSDTYCKLFVCLLLGFPSLFYSHIAICFLSQIWYFWVFFSILWFLCTAVLPTIDKLSLSVISIVFITRGWYSDLGMPIILFWWKLPCYWGRLWVFHFQLDGTFHFLVQGYSDVDAVGDGLYCAFDYYYALLDYQMRFLHLTASSSRDWFWLPVNLGLK